MGLEDQQTCFRRYECLNLDPTELLKVYSCTAKGGGGGEGGVGMSLPLLPQINYEADCSQRHALPSDSESLDCLDGPSPEPGADRRESSVSLSGSVNSEDILCNRSPDHHSTVPRPFSDPSIPDSLKMEEGGTYIRTNRCRFGDLLPNVITHLHRGSNS